MIPRNGLVVVLIAILLGMRAASAAPVPGGVSGPVPGEPAPKIEIERLLNAPDGAKTSWQALRGKVVVLVFWATTCSPCVASIPGMNKLETALANEKIVFIHISDEEESVVTKFLKRTPISGWVGIDDDRKTSRNYGVKGLPHVAVVGRDGTFLGWNDPRILVIEPETLKDVLAKGHSEGLWSRQKSAADPLGGIARDATTGERVRNLCDIVIRRSDASSAKRKGGGDGRGDWRFDRPLRHHIASFCDVPSARIIATVSLPEDHYDVIALGVPGTWAAMHEAVCRLLSATFELSFVREKRLMDVYLLKTVPDREPTLTPSWGGIYNDTEEHLMAPSKEILERMKNGEHHFFTLCPLSMLADNVSEAAGKPVVAELGELPKKADRVYSFCFPCPRGDAEAFRKAFEKQVGLVLVPAQREVEVLVVGPAKRPTLGSGN